MVRESLTVAYRDCGGVVLVCVGREVCLPRLVLVVGLGPRGRARGVVSPSKSSSLAVGARVASLLCGY